MQRRVSSEASPSSAVVFGVCLEKEKLPRCKVLLFVSWTLYELALAQRILTIRAD